MDVETCRGSGVVALSAVLVWMSVVVVEFASIDIAVAMDALG